jgi:beta-lactam-binding protein with PASTA domain
LFYTIPARWIYLTIHHNIHRDEFFEKIRKHCVKTDIKELKEKGYVAIPITSGKEASQGTLFHYFEKEEIPYWGVESSLAGVNYKQYIQMQTLDRNGFKTLPFWELSKWLKQDISNESSYILSSNEYQYDEKQLIIEGEHEINAFKQFLTDDPKPTETQRNRKYWKHFFEQMRETDRLRIFIQEKRHKDEMIISFYHSKNANGFFERRYLKPVHIVVSEAQQNEYLFTPAESVLIKKIMLCWESLTGHFEHALRVLHFKGPGYIRCHIDLFEDLSFHVTFKEINPLFPVGEEWLEKQLIYNNIGWNTIISEQNEFATFSPPPENEYEREESILSMEENKLPFHKVNSDIVVENAVVWEEKTNEERENSINEAMNNLKPTRFSRSLNDYLTDIGQFLKSRFFIKNLLAFILSVFIMVQMVKGLLYLYTRHGSGRVVADYTGKRFVTALEEARQQGFHLVTSDEVYVLNRPSGIIISQVPEKGSNIKSGRTIFCVVTGGNAPSVTLPKLSNNDEYEAYQKQLIRLGIYSRIREERFEAEYEEKTIMEVYFEGRKLSNSRINAGLVKLPKGSYLDFVISVRNTDRTPVPQLVCNTYEEAVTNITANDLIVGTIIGPENNESFSGMYVIKQEPAAGEGVFLPKGSAIILYLQKEKPEQCPEY